MSYAISVYTINNQLITTEQLKSRLEEMGWAVTFVSGDHISRQVVVAPDGPLLDGVNIYRWRVDEKDATLFHGLMSEGKFKELWDLPLAFMVIATCSVSFSMSYDISQDWDEEEIAELEYFDEEYIQYLRSAKADYGIQAGKSNRSIALTRDVGHAIGHTVGGLFDDPHEGTHEFLKIQ